MKKSAILLAASGLALGSLHAQLPQTVPLYLNYQGKITSGSGVPIGSAGTAPNFTPAPENRKVIFRIFGSQSGTDRLWSEVQTVTISLGEFSVLLGQGGIATYENIAEARPALDSIFTGPPPPAIPAPPADGPARWLEIVVDTDANGSFTAAADLPIAPRQRLTTTPYSFRARIADSLTASAVNEFALATDAVTTLKIKDGAVNNFKLGLNAVTSDKILNGTILTEDLAPLAVDNGKLAGGAVDSNKVLDNSLTTLDILNNTLTADDIADNSIGNLELADNAVGTGNIANDAVTVDKLAPGIGFWVTSADGLSVYRAGNNVGIGTSTPDRSLSIAHTNGLNIGYEAATFTSLAISLTAAANGKATLQARSAFPTYGDLLLNPAGGFVGIGLSAPRAPLEVSGSASSSFNYQANLDANGFVSDQNFTTSRNAAIIANGPMRCTGLDISSDARIKKIISRSNSVADLATVMSLEVTDYTFKDTAANGSPPQKKVIAQQVEKVFPLAVSQSTAAVPDIFRMAGFKDGWVTLATDLKPGERVRLTGPKSEGVYEVLEVSEGRFRTAFTSEGDKVFVYGREVNDFRSVDYDAIAMLNVSATQQIKKEKDAEVKALQDENAAQTKQIAALEQRLAAQEQQFAELKASEKVRETKLAAIEKLLEAAVSTGSTARTVSLKTASAK